MIFFFDFGNNKEVQKHQGSSSDFQRVTIWRLWRYIFFPNLIYNRENNRSQSSTTWHIQEKHGFYFLMQKSQNSSTKKVQLCENTGLNETEVGKNDVLCFPQRFHLKHMRPRPKTACTILQFEKKTCHFGFFFIIAIISERIVLQIPDWCQMEAVFGTAWAEMPIWNCRSICELWINSWSKLLSRNP